MKRVVEWILGILCVLVIAAIMFPVFASGHPVSHRTPCLSSLKQSSTAMLIYRADADGGFPDRDEWVDVLYPYTKRWEVFHCPKVLKTPWGYAFNGALSRTNEKDLRAPDTVPMLYDSANPMKNASDLYTSPPTVPRHERNCVSYADGHARALVKR